MDFSCTDSPKVPFVVVTMISYRNLDIAYSMSGHCGTRQEQRIWDSDKS